MRTIFLCAHVLLRPPPAGDALLFGVVGGEDGSCEAWFESRDRRDSDAVTQRNRELAAATETLLRGSRSTDVHIWDLIVALLARGAYHADLATDPPLDVLGADARGERDTSPAGCDPPASTG